eukprot:GEMP01078079.1.p1 GENE.GEMP01078079.1~~GEMP01078079.1.p1  ORF type:complete len:180 (+),score=23.44 GEMP01078079.1:53-592(+)
MVTLKPNPSCRPNHAPVISSDEGSFFFCCSNERGPNAANEASCMPRKDLFFLGRESEEDETQGEYRGQMVDNKPNGKGVLRRKDGGLYEGEFRDGYIWGHGTFIHSSNDKYEGQWVQDKAHAITLARSVGKEFSTRQTEHRTKDCSRMISCMARAYTASQTRKYIKDSGRNRRCMGMEP